ncbi:MAG: 4Fe-4S binding protein [Deltaproteobacteria bacterium]|jgi:polyferredoxin|nr:4Fe-4S binding protein [Deltaproteobacteria bacterium]
MEKRLKNAVFLILVTLVLAIVVPVAIRFIPHETRTHHISLKAKKYGYSPSRIVVNKGDTIVLKPTSLDVTHGFLLDGYPVDLVIKQQGLNFLKYTWEDDEGALQTDWDKVSQVEFVADKSGKFTFRCTQTCGGLHPFMTGELIVGPNTVYHLFMALSIWLTISLLGLFRVTSKSLFSGFRKRNLLERFPWFKRIVKLRSFQFLVTFPNLIVFYLFIISALWGSPVGNHNIAIIFVWIAWWFALKAILVPLGGRIWCMVCPLPAPSEWISRKSFTAVRYLQKPFRGLHHRFTGLQKDWPKRISNIWLQNILFLALISFGIILITRPVATAMMFLLILAATLVLGLIFRRRVFCLYLCPVGGFLGTYSMASITEIRAIDPEVCRKHKEKPCLKGGPNGWACPWKQYPGKMSRNNYCGLCTECIKSCPKDNMGLFLRPFGSDRNLKGYDEMFNAIIMLVVAIAFSVTMLGPWGFIKEAANVTETRQVVPFLTYLAALWGLALVVVPSLFAASAKGAGLLVEEDVNQRTLTLRLAYILIPVGIFFWIAFSLPPVMINYNYILSVLSDPLGLGWDIFGTANYPFNPLIPEWIPAIQGTLLLAGLYFGLSRGYLALGELFSDPRSRARAMIFPSLFALLMVNVLGKLYMG